MTIEGKQAYLEFLTWLFAQEPPGCHVLEDVFTGPSGNAFLTHNEHDGRGVIQIAVWFGGGARPDWSR